MLPLKQLLSLPESTITTNASQDFVKPMQAVQPLDSTNYNSINIIALNFLKEPTQEGQFSAVLANPTDNSVDVVYSLV